MLRRLHFLAFAGALCCFGGSLIAQDQEPGPRRGRPDGDGPRGERPDEREGRFGGPPMRGGPAPGEFMRMMPVLAALDADSDGEISTAELENAVAALKKLDKNQDGKLTEDEVRPEFPGPRGRGGFGGPEGFRPPGFGGPGRPEGSAEQTIARLMQFDRNQDGKLAKEEFPERVRAIFTQADADKDGFATREELAAMLANDQPRDRGEENRERPAGERPRGDRPRGDRPPAERPRGDSPAEDRSDS